MKTTLFFALPWLRKKLTTEEMELVDEYVDDSIQEALDDQSWYDVEGRFGWKIDEIIQDGIAYDAEILRKSILEVAGLDGGWRWHNNHGHAGSLDMCSDEVCLILTEQANMLYNCI